MIRSQGLGTVTEAIEYLKDKTAYAPYVERMDVSLYHREMWRRSCISRCSMIIRGSSGLPVGAEDVLKIILETV